MKLRILCWLLAVLLLLPLTPRAAAADPDEALVEALKGFFLQAEGDYGSVNADDGGAVSLGLLQWHGPRALELLRFALEGWPGCANYLTRSLYLEIVSPAASWKSRSLSGAEAERVSALLASPDGRAAQDALARRDILGYLSQARAWGMESDATAAYFAVIINQFGSGGAAAYLSRIRATLGLGEAAVFRDLNVLHQAVHDTAYGRAALAMRDKSYAYLVSLGWPLSEPRPRRRTVSTQAPAFVSPVGRSWDLRELIGLLLRLAG